MSSPPFWLSHHPEAELARTYRLGGVHVCARCLGTYPVLFSAIALQIAVRAPLRWRWDGLVAVGLLLPALLDWAYGRFRPLAGSNAWRTGTGVLLGLALGRTLYVHFRSPLPLWLLVQAALVTAVAVPVIVLRLRRQGRG
ncbi:MAG: DUF2085 domain-containing protein [Myxococcaceae bacterium]|nr:DUF2085 domain-containing protein [Myxococcaceae bacterium]